MAESVTNTKRTIKAGEARTNNVKGSIQVVYVINENTRSLAATCYGESSTDNVFEEMAGIANVLVKQQKARKYPSVKAFIKADKNFAYAAHDGNARFEQFMAASYDEIKRDKGMEMALRAAHNALSEKPTDYSNGAYFFDGADIKSNYANHAKVNDGIHFINPSHNIYDIKEKDVPGEEYWRDVKGNKTKLRGTWKYKFESTTAHGGTIFWKYNANFLKASSNKEYN